MYGQVSPRRSLGLLARWSAPLVLAFAAGCGGAPEGDLDALDKGTVSTPEAVSSEEFTGGERTPKATVFTPNSDAADQIALATDLSMQVLKDNLESLGLSSLDELQIREVRIDELGMAHAKFQQVWQGVEVFAGQIIVHLDATGTAVTLTDGLVPWVNKDLSVKPEIGAVEAEHLVVGGYDCASCLTDKPGVDMQVLRRDGVDHLAYRVQLRRIDGTAETAMPVVFLDAHTGEKVWSYDNLQTAAATGSGASLYNGSSVSFGTSNFSSTYYLEDVTKKLGTFTFNNGPTTVYRFAPDADNVWAKDAAIDAHYGAAKTYDYYKNVHGRNGIDGNGGPGAYSAAENSAMGLISSVVHYSTNYGNAFWDGSKMTYGDGDGSTFSALTTLDIAGHEITHGVTERTAGLVYSNESGALNESMSDVFGAMIERSVNGETTNTWRIGEQCYTPANGTGDALRYMDDPHLAGNGGYTSNDDPDHYSERYTGAEDNGGVHINSGIANKAFYLAAKGGTHHLGTTVTGMGADNAARVWYRALTTYMTTSTNFSGARTATINAATDLFGASSTQVTAATNAWCAVGVGTCASGGGGGGGGGELLVNGTFEGSVSPWVMSGTGALYVANGVAPQGGTGYIYFGAANSVTGQTYQQFTIPAAASTASLTFYLNVTSAETTTTTQYDKLFVEVRNSSGTLLATLATYSNLNKVAASTTYSLKTFSLLAYKGQTIRVQFRTTTDSAAITTFRVDTASVK